MMWLRCVILMTVSLAAVSGCRTRNAVERLPDGGLKTLTLEDLAAISRARRAGLEPRRGETPTAAREGAPEPPPTRPAVGDGPDGGEPALNFNYRMVPAMVFNDGCGPKSQRCTLMGRCAEGGGECVAVSAADCRRSMFCRAEGRCGLKGGACVATDGADCRASNGCRYRGDCSLRGNECVAVRPSDCLESLWCKKSGVCTARGDRCVAASRGDCLASSLCREVGACSERDGICVIAGDKDCRIAVACHNLGQCRFDSANRTCIAKTDDDCASAEVCAKFQACRAKGKVCVK
ncbi:MAG: hypothetical protein HYY84_09035 [Deltaproteobacteria bacterium]|nr:hypothetical protein [Deltaproteobacteria bacterium]